MQNISKPLLSDLKQEIELALIPIGKKHGVSFQFKGGSFSPTVATLKLEVGAIGNDGSASTKESEAFKFNARFFGLAPENLGAKVVLNHEQFEIIGLLPKSRKFPILCKRSDGKQFKFSASHVLLALGKK